MLLQGDSGVVGRDAFSCQTLCLSLHVISRDLCITTCISGQFTNSLRENISSLNCHLFVRLHAFCEFFKYR